jgi:hypothetical protein
LPIKSTFAIKTVIVINGLGRAILTAKQGAIRKLTKSGNDISAANADVLTDMGGLNGVLQHRGVLWRCAGPALRPSIPFSDLPDAEF